MLRCLNNSPTPAQIKDMLLRWSKAKTRGYEVIYIWILLMSIINNDLLVNDHSPHILCDRMSNKHFIWKYFFSPPTLTLSNFFLLFFMYRMSTLKIFQVVGLTVWHSVLWFIIFSPIHLNLINLILIIVEKILHLPLTLFSE